MRISDWSSDVCSSDLSAFGSEGPLASRVGFDAVGQAMSGTVHLTGTPDQPYRAQVNYVDFGTALHCAFGIMLALRTREATGKGQCVSGSLLGTALALSNALTLDHALNRSEEHTSELQSLMRTSYAVFCLKKKKNNNRYKLT